MSTTLMLAPDAAIAVGIASTALPFALNRAEEVERWLRVLRLHGQAGIALQSLGVGESPLQDLAKISGQAHGATVRPNQEDVVAHVSELAAQIAQRRSSECVATVDVLLAVMSVYGEDFDSVLRAHGADRDELIERLGVDWPLD